MSQNKGRNNEPSSLVIKDEDDTVTEAKEVVEEVVKNNNISKPQQFVVSPVETKANQPAKREIEVSTIDSSLMIYENKFATARNDQEFANAQYFLFTIITGILKTKDNVNFKKDWNSLLNYFHVRKNNMNEFTLFQGMKLWVGSESEFNIYRRMVTVILATAKPETRLSSVSKMNVEVVLSTLSSIPGYGVNARNRIATYYNL